MAKRKEEARIKEKIQLQELAQLQQKGASAQSLATTKNAIEKVPMPAADDADTKPTNSVEGPKEIKSSTSSCSAQSENHLISNNRSGFLIPNPLGFNLHCTNQNKRPYRNREPKSRPTPEVHTS